jgi:hypothetical protein
MQPLLPSTFDNQTLVQRPGKEEDSEYETGRGLAQAQRPVSHCMPNRLVFNLSRCVYNMIRDNAQRDSGTSGS